MQGTLISGIHTLQVFIHSERKLLLKVVNKKIVFMCVDKFYQTGQNKQNTILIDY